MIAVELRFEGGDASNRPVSLNELERVWVLHSAFVNYLTRKHVHRRVSLPERDGMIDLVIDLFLDGATHPPGKQRSPRRANGSSRVAAAPPPAPKRRRSEPAGAR